MFGLDRIREGVPGFERGVMRNPDGLHRVRRMLFVAGVAVLACGHAAGAQTVRGLVIGIDDYAHEKPLRGAVNDAEDISSALREIGVDDLTVLLDGDATRNNIVVQWQALMDRARRGDTLVLTYAGHGSQEKERVAETEPDGKDEVLVLGGFSRKGEGTGERIFDDEIHQWFLDAGRKGLRVIFVADSCHSGTLTRSVDPRAPAQTYRYVPPYELPNDSLELDLPQGAADTAEAGTGDLPHVSFLAGSQDHETVPEIPLPPGDANSQPRGALSYMFARAVRGEADDDGDGVLQGRELWRFVRENVRKESGSRQTPNLQPKDPGDKALLPLRRTATEPAPGTSATPGVTRLHVRDAGPEVLAALRERLPDVRMVSDKESHDFVWDAGRGDVITGLGDVAAYDMDVDDLPGVIRKWEAVRAIKALSARNSLRLRLDPHDGLHRRGARLAVRVEGLEGRWLTVFSLAGNGVVQHLHSGPSGHPTVPTDVPFRFEIETEVIPPFGADHVVAVSADSPLDALNDRLMRLDGSNAATELADVLAEASGWSLGIQGLYTAP